MVARLKLEGIDGRAPQGVEPAAQFDSTRGNLPGPDIVRIDRREVVEVGFCSSSALSLLRALSRFYGWWCMAVRSWWVILSGLFR